MKEIIMNIRTILWGTTSAMLLFVWFHAWAQTAPEPYRAPLQQLVPPSGEEPVYGWQLMTGAERDLIHERLSRAQSVQEREQIRADHHRQMQDRARQMGYNLPEEPGMHQQMMQQHMQQPMMKHRRGW
jgi:hypothetical protein